MKSDDSWLASIEFVGALTLYASVCATIFSHAHADEQVLREVSSGKYSFVGQTVVEGIRDGEAAGVVVVIASRDEILYARAFGDRQVSPDREAMTIDTVFDLASISKPLSTATSVMILADQGKVDLEATAAKYLPEFGKHGKDVITIHQLLIHTAGLIPDNSIRDYQDGPTIAWERICELKLRSSPGEKFSYTDVGYMVLGKLVQQVSGMTLDQFAKKNVFDPLRMTETSYNPPKSFRLRAAATEIRDGSFIKGHVHDPRAFLLDGVAGHAGVFSTASDLVRYGRMILNKGKPIMSEHTFESMVKPRDIKRGTRTFGWDHKSPYSSNRGNSFSDSAIGHGGFTGTVFWVDPELDRIFIFLSNRLHPDGKGSVNAIAGKIASRIPYDK